MNNMPMPLEGIKVVELSTVVAAPTTARMLCAYGAEVIKVEALHGDECRNIGFIKKAPSEDYKNPMFTVHNSNKKLTSINIKTEAGKEALHRLLSRADIFVTNVREGSLERMELNYDSIKDRYPSLIYAQFYGYGPKGPAAGDPGFDSTAFWMRSGPLADWTVEGEHPFYPTYAFGDMATSSVLLSGILMALYARERTGHGTMVSTSLFASGIWCNATGVVSTQFQKKHLNPNYEYPIDPFDTFYECGDGRWIAVYCNDYVRDRGKFAKCLDIMDIMEDSRWDCMENLEKDGFMTEATKRVAAIFKSKPAAKWREILSKASISCEIMQRTCEVSKDPQALENGYVEELEFADGVKAMMPSPPVFFRDYTRRPYEITGKIGEHTDGIFADMGYTSEEIERMKQEKAIR